MTRPRQLRAVPGLLGLAVLIAAVVAMHSMGAGHQRDAVVHGASAAHEPAAMHSIPVPVGETGRCGSCPSHLGPVGDAHETAPMCLAVLTGLMLLALGRRLTHGRARLPLGHDRRRQLARRGRAPPGLLAPSLSQLGVLRI